MKALISLFDFSGNQSRPYKENGFLVERIDIKLGRDIFDFNPVRWLNNNSDYSMPEIYLIAPVPCTCYALSGNRHKAARLLNGEFEASQKLVSKTYEIINWFDKVEILRCWMVENPSSDIHKHNTWLGEVRQKFNPCDFAGYAQAKQAISYPLRVYDFKLWERILEKAKKNDRSINAEIEAALRLHAPDKHNSKLDKKIV